MRVLIHLFLLSAAFIGFNLSEGRAISNNTVLDRDGKKLLPNTNYTILPVSRRQGGGLTIALQNGTCPFNVVQEISPLSCGLPVTFLPVNTSIEAIMVSMEMNIVFSKVDTICSQSMVWRISKADNRTGRSYVTTGGVTGYHGASTWSNLFKLKRYGDCYKLVFCPRVFGFRKKKCGDVGVFVGLDGKRWLGLSDIPLAVVFQKIY